MATNRSPTPSRLNSVDRHGRHIDPTVLAAAEEVFPRALDYGVKVLGDSAIVANLLEDVAAKVSRVIATRDPPGEPGPIHNLAAYIFRAFARDVNRIRTKQLVLVSSSGAGQASAQWTDPSRQLEAQILVDELLAKCDSVTQDMFAMRMQGFTWEEIGRIYETSAHAAEKRFSQALRHARARLKMINGSKYQNRRTGATLRQTSRTDPAKCDAPKDEKTPPKSAKKNS